MIEEQCNGEDLKAHREFVALERKLSEGGGLQGFQGDSKRFHRRWVSPWPPRVSNHPHTDAQAFAEQCKEGVVEEQRFEQVRQ